MKIILSQLKNLIREVLESYACDEGEGTTKGGDGGFIGPGYVGSQEDESVDNKLDEKAPRGWEGTVKKMKTHDKIENPWALAHSMKNKGYRSHYTKSGKRKKS